MRPVALGASREMMMMLDCVGISGISENEGPEFLRPEYSSRSLTLRTRKQGAACVQTPLEGCCRSTNPETLLLEQHSFRGRPESSDSIVAGTPPLPV